MLSIFLDTKDVRRTVGARSNLELLAWLRENGVPHLVSRRGDPLVTEVGLRQAAGERPAADAAPPRAIDFDALRAAAQDGLR